MKTDIRLNSVVDHGVGGPECGALDLIYRYLLHEFDQDHYNHITINQIGIDLDEFVMKEQSSIVHVNILHPTAENFELKTIDEKNMIRLNIIHEALIRIANYDGKFDISKLNAIKKKILDHNFCFDFVYKVHVYKKNPKLIGKVIVRPLMDKFEFYVVIQQNNIIQCKQIIFTGITTFYYFDRYFCYAKWKNEKRFVVYGKEKIVETHILTDSCTVEILNLSPYENPPYYTLMRVDISDEVREKADFDWQHSINPAHLAIIRQSLGNGGN